MNLHMYSDNYCDNGFDYTIDRCLYDADSIDCGEGFGYGRAGEILHHDDRNYNEDMNWCGDGLISEIWNDYRLCRFIVETPK